MLGEVIKVKCVEELLDLLMKYGEKAKIIAGGTDIVIQLRKGKINPNVLIDISSIEELKYIENKDGFIEIGAGTTFSEIEKSEYFNYAMQGISKAAEMVGSPQIRNGASIGGNICNGSPAADGVPPLLALDAVAIIKSKSSQRELPLEKFFLGKEKVDLMPDEILYGIRFKELGEGMGLSFSKLGLRKALAISRISTAVMVHLEDNICTNVRIASGSLGEYGVRERKVEEYFIGKTIDDGTIEEGLKILRMSINDRLFGRSSLPYKVKAVEGTFVDAMKTAFNIAMKEDLLSYAD